MKELINFLIDNKDYAPLYSSIVALMALVFSIFSFCVSTILTILRNKIANKRYNEQKEQYETRLKEERERRLEDKLESEERIRICECPYLICKEANIIFIDRDNSRIIFSMKFLNKGRGASYEITPDTKCTASLLGNTFTVYRYENVEDHIVQVNETFETKWFYEGKKAVYGYRMPFSIQYKDASERMYKQDFVVDIIDHNTINVINYAKPILCK